MTRTVKQFRIDANRLAKITTLAKGAHAANNDGLACIMEAVAWTAHKEWTDHPACVCPVLGAFMRGWNDGIADDAERTALLMPFIPKLLNTKGSAELERCRSVLAADWLLRTHTVAWLRLAKLNTQADLLAALPEITDFAQCPSIMPTLMAVRNDASAAWDAAGAAAWDAARAAAWDAAGDAAWAAAWDAAGAAAWDAARAAAGAAAWDAAWDAARAAAWDAARAAAWAAAWDAARAAAWDALSKTKAELQQSAIALVHRMIDLKDK